MDFFDPHFHVWDVSEGTTSGHDAAILFAPEDDPVYSAQRYEAHLSDLPAPLRHVGGVFLEAVSVCHVDMPGTDPKYIEYCKAEAAWAHAQLAASDKSYLLVPTCPLEAPQVADVLKEYEKFDNFRGVRQIVNMDPAWPRNGGVLGDPLLKPEWVKGLSVLAARGHSFDLQLNPNQFAKFAEIYATVPNMTVIINHLGCPTLADLTERPDQFFDGLTALAKFPNCYMKLSMQGYTDEKWDQNPVVTDAITRVIDIFGPGRCMFASNYPPDLKVWPANKLFPAFLKVAEKYDDATKALLFAGTARKAYRA
eukprot:m.95106 g.95106  ORF g.95106 m.95106 type:complete len:309 (-) comp10087_c1_seq1:132-1058(-)